MAAAAVILAEFSNAAGISGQLAWSEKLAAAGMTTNTAPANAGREGQPSLEIANSTAGDIFVSIGPTPDTTAGPVLLVRLSETRNVLFQSGDKVAWSAA